MPAEDLKPIVEATYGGLLRLRVCAIIGDEAGLLLIKHNGLGELGYYWSPPGGGVKFGEELMDCLVREVKEETGLIVTPGHYMFGNQYIKPPLHAVELFFRAEPVGGELKLGHDPEWQHDSNMLASVTWMSWEDIKALPKAAKHHAFHFATSWQALCDLPSWLPPQL